MAISTQLVALIKNIYTLWGLPRLLLPVTYFFFWTNLIYRYITLVHKKKCVPGRMKRGERNKVYIFLIRSTSWGDIAMSVYLSVRLFVRVNNKISEMVRPRNTKLGMKSFFIPNLVLLGLTFSEISLFTRTWLYRLSLSPWSRIYILYGVCHASFCLLHTFIFLSNLIYPLGIK